jgi:hypothetical protein
MLRSALFMTERILQASPPTTRWGKMIAYDEPALQRRESAGLSKAAFEEGQLLADYFENSR